MDAPSGTKSSVGSRARASAAQIPQEARWAFSSRGTERREEEEISSERSCRTASTGQRGQTPGTSRVVIRKTSSENKYPNTSSPRHELREPLPDLVAQQAARLEEVVAHRGFPAAEDLARSRGCPCPRTPGGRRRAAASPRARPRSSRTRAAPRPRREAPARRAPRSCGRPSRGESSRPRCAAACRARAGRRSRDCPRCGRATSRTPRPGRTGRGSPRPCTNVSCATSRASSASPRSRLRNARTPGVRRATSSAKASISPPAARRASARSSQERRAARAGLPPTGPPRPAARRLRTDGGRDEMHRFGIFYVSGVVIVYQGEAPLPPPKYNLRREWSGAINSCQDSI